MNSAVGLKIDEMRQCFVQGKHLDMWNLNGHAYFGVDELAQLWRHLQTVYDLTLCRGDSETHVTVMGDMAVVTWERMLMDTRAEGRQSRFAIAGSAAPRCTGATTARATDAGPSGIATTPTRRRRVERRPGF